MFSLLTVILAFLIGIAWGMSAVWAVTKNYAPAIVTFGGSIVAAAVLTLRIIAELA